MNPRFMHGSLVIALAVFFCLWSTRVIPAEQGTPGVHSVPASPSTATILTPSSAAIPVSEIATTAAEATNAVQTLSTHLARSHAIEGIKTQLPDVRGRTRLELEETTAMLRGEPSLEMIQARQKLWQGKQVLTKGWLKTLTERVVQLKGSIDRLEAMRKQWTVTREVAQASNAPVLILQEIDAVTAAIDGARTPLEAQRADLLDLQAEVSQEVSRCESALSQIDLAAEGGRRDSNAGTVATLELRSVAESRDVIAG